MDTLDKLRLGPVVGHTDDRSSRIWIRVYDDPARYALTVHGVGEFPFVSTEQDFEFGTAVAVADGLRAHRPYRYTVRRFGKSLAGASGSFQTMPPAGHMSEVSFVVVSCNDTDVDGAWEKLGKFLDDARPNFILMIGDQVYADSVFEDDLTSPPDVRRQKLAELYQASWSRPSVAEVLANIPCYMIWDDHEIRDGWGSFAPDSATLSAEYSLGRPIHDKYVAYYRDARDVYLHFQMSHNPPPPLDQGKLMAAMPFVFRVGRVAVLVVDNRGDRDLWRKQSPVLGEAQWKFLTSVVDNLAKDIDAVMVVTPVPIVSSAPYGAMQRGAGSRHDDVTFLRNGDEESLNQMATEEDDLKDLPALLATMGTAAAGFPIGFGNALYEKIDDARDQWSNGYCRAEQERLLRLAARARTANRTGGQARGLLFVGGDLHVGCLFQIDMASPKCTFQCLISSGVAKVAKQKFPGLLGSLVDEDFDVAEGIHASLQYLVDSYNFGLVTVVPDGQAAQISAHVVEAGKRTDPYGFRLKVERPRGLKRLQGKLPGL